MAAELKSGNGAGRGASVALSDLEKKFERVNAVDGVSLDIRSGEFLTLLGPSGSGKTTTLMMIAGFEMPTAGDIAIDGTSVIAMPPYRRNIGMVFQNYALFPHLTVEDNIGFPLRQRGVPRRERARLADAALRVSPRVDYAQGNRGQQARSGLRPKTRQESSALLDLSAKAVPLQSICLVVRAVGGRRHAPGRYAPCNDTGTVPTHANSCSFSKFTRRSNTPCPASP